MSCQFTILTFLNILLTLLKISCLLSTCFVSIGYVLRVQAGQAPMGVHSDNRDYKRGSKPTIFRLPSAPSGYKISSVDRGQSAREYHTADTKSSQIQSHYPYPVIPETQNSNVPKSQDDQFKSVFNSASLTRGRSTVAYNRSGNKVLASPDGKKIPQTNSESVFSTGAVQVPPRVHHARATSRGGFSPVQVDNAPVGFGPEDRKALIYSHSSTASPNIQAIKYSLKFESAGKVGTQMSYPMWSPKAYSSDVMSEARGYAHVRRLRPGFDKTRPQASSAAGRKFLETGFLSVKQNQGRYSHDSTKLGFGLPASSERQLNLNYNSRGSQPGNWHPPPPNRAQTPVQGKFKPFQRLPTNDDLLAHTHSSDGETAPTQTFAGTTRHPSLNSTGTTSSVVPSVTGELSTKSASPMQTESLDAELVPQASNCEGQSERPTTEVGPSLEQTKPFTLPPPELQPAESEQSPLETDQSGVQIDAPDAA